MINIQQDFISISDKHGEIVRWLDNEWIEDPAVTAAISNAIDIYHTKGSEYLRDIIDNKIFNSEYANKLAVHLHHDVSIVSYHDMKNNIINVSLECNECNEVILDSRGLELDEWE